MAHYDYLYEEISKEKVEEEILKIEKDIIYFQEKINKMKNDIPQCSCEFSKEAIEDKIYSLKYNILERKIEGVKMLKSKINDGSKVYKEDLLF